MTLVLRNQVAGKKRDLLLAFAAGRGFDPKEVFNMSLFGSTLEAACTIQPADFCSQVAEQIFAGYTIGIEVKMLYLLLYDPVRHRVDIVADHIATETIGFE